VSAGVPEDEDALRVGGEWGEVALGDITDDRFDNRIHHREQISQLLFEPGIPSRRDFKCENARFATNANAVAEFPPPVPRSKTTSAFISSAAAASISAWGNNRFPGSFSHAKLWCNCGRG